MTIFDKRVAFKPYEYPETMGYVDAINQNYWVHGEWNFISDVHDFHVKISPSQKTAIKNTLLAISQIEVSVKSFWANMAGRLPKPEFSSISATFSESEVRHERAYSHLLEILNLNGDFDLLLQNPVIQGRVDYLTKYLKGSSDNTNENYTLTLVLFALFIENVSLFSQFAIIKSFNKHLNILKDIDNVVQATRAEEVLHAAFGTYLINVIKKEFPQWFNDEFYEKIYRACKKAYESEANIIDWIFEEGEVSFISKDSLKEFIKYRFNESLATIGGHPVFTVDDEKIKTLQWFIEEIHADNQVDFFYKKSTNYVKSAQSITENDLF